ncbi:MAG TPA: LPS assembly protein LptD [Patescibacteria group bacterium]|nr:LPS assembly protein LptD [Patescibacteria group bacterium]
MLAGLKPALAQEAAVSDLPVNFQSKQLSHDDEKQTVTALGDVELVQGERVLRADKMVYHLDTDTVEAIGNVSLLDEQGNVSFAEYVSLNKSMKDGFIHSLLSLLADGSRFTAEEARRENGTKLTLTDASYTPCKVCETDPKPLWQIKADKVVHDSVEKSMKYKNARLEFAGVPLAFAPIFSHADPSVKRKSGFLRSSYGYSSEQGAHVQTGYYFGDIRPDVDATLMVRPTTQAGVLVQGEVRKRFENGRMQLDGGVVNSDRHEEDGRVEEDRLRGHIFGNGLFNLDEKWRAGFDVQRVSDKEYLRLYDISKANVLESRAYAERFDGRDYTNISAFNFQDVRLGLRPDQPDVLPSLEHRSYGEPGRLLGGRWTAGLQTLELRRSGADQDVQRGSADIGWERRDVSRQGFVSRVSLNGRGDFYAVQDSTAAVLNPTLESSEQESRGMAVASAEFSYPMLKRVEKAQVLIEPRIGISASPETDDTPLDIPNEDSIDIQLDTNNLFSDNRFPGIDRVEDGVRINYGIQAGLFGDNGRYGKVFLGQSYRFDDDLIFPNGSGLEDNSSDVVGQINASVSKYLTGDYRFQMDNRNLVIHRHEFQAHLGNDVFSANGKYIFIDPTAGTGFIESRQQALVDGTYNFTPHWWLNAAALADMGEEPGFRKAALGINYADECFSFSLQGARNLINEASGENGTILMMRVGFKNLGEFSAPGIRLNKGTEQE